MDKNSDNISSSKLRAALLQRIEQEQLKPRSRLFFNSREYVLWTLWLLSILVGALAVAVSAFVVVHNQYALYEATHENFFTFLVDILPFVWLLVFISMAYFALYNLRHTRHGYRYSVTTVVASSIVLSFALGSALQFFGWGDSVDALLGEQMDLYISQEEFEQDLWQQPQRGRMVGVQRFETVEADKYVIFEDIDGNRWRLNVVELVPPDRGLLAEQKMVRILGTTTDEKAKLFHACGIFTWMFNDGITRSELSSSRKTFLQKLAQFHQQAEYRLEQIEKQAAKTASTSNAPKESVCANLAIVH